MGHWHIDEGAYGALTPGGAAADPDTIFDLASVTKPFVAAGLARLFRCELITPDTPLGVLLREAQGTASANVPLELLLAHRAGLEGHRPLYAPLEQGRALHRFSSLAEAAGARKADCLGAPEQHGFAPTYSDLGYLLLGEAMSRACRLPLDAVVQRETAVPLGVDVRSARQWMTGPAQPLQIAPTEVIGWRGGTICGRVHDENAWALCGDGICGHAGLFGRAREVARFGASLLDALADRCGHWLAPQDLDRLIRPRHGGTLRAGFDGKSDNQSSAGALCSAQAFGHLGFTGTSLWIDPEQRIVVVLLSNRVYPTRNNDAIKQARPDVHDALWRWRGRAPRP